MGSSKLEDSMQNSMYKELMGCLLFCLFLVSALVLLFCLCNSGGEVKDANGQEIGQGQWCVPKPSTSDQKLQEILDFACSAVEEECSVIQPGGHCFEPSTLMNYASVAMNLYYQKMGRNSWNCDYNSSGIIAVTDPSYGECKFLYA